MEFEILLRRNVGCHRKALKAYHRVVVVHRSSMYGVDVAVCMDVEWLLVQAYLELEIGDFWNLLLRMR